MWSGMENQIIKKFYSFNCQHVLLADWDSAHAHETSITTIHKIGRDLHAIIGGLYARKCHRNHGCTRMQYRRTNIARSDLFLVVLFLKKPNLMHQPPHYNGAIINPTGALATLAPALSRWLPVVPVPPVIFGC